VQLTPDVFWHVFQSTGSVRAYLAYRRFSELGQALVFVTLSLN